MSKFTIIAREQHGNVLRQYRVDEEDFETAVANLRKAIASGVPNNTHEPTVPPVIGEAS